MSQSQQGVVRANSKPPRGSGVSALCTLIPCGLESQIQKNQERDCLERRGSWLMLIWLDQKRKMLPEKEMARSRSGRDRHRPDTLNWPALRLASHPTTVIISRRLRLSFVLRFISHSPTQLTSNASPTLRLSHQGKRQPHTLNPYPVFTSSSTAPAHRGLRRRQVVFVTEVLRRCLDPFIHHHDRYRLQDTHH